MRRGSAYSGAREKEGLSVPYLCLIAKFNTEKGSSMRIVTLLSDFGLQDHYVAAMKGVMLGINPDLNIIDVTHMIAPQDIMSAAFVLGQAFPCFPRGTIHVAVVDPGVGTSRKALAAFAGDQFFVAPDNGILTYVAQSQENFRAYEITADHYFRKPVSSTFHGRDIFAPVAAYISRGIDLAKFGPVLEKPKQLPVPKLQKVGDSLMQATVLAVDRFGNAVTNLRAEDVPVFEAANARPCKFLAGQKEIGSFRRAFGEGRPGEIFVVPGSSGYLEIVMRDGSASSELNLRPGDVVGVVLL
jgi:S-adenosyl-L-methionine hydrolase (adenosine-forming)